MNRRFLLLPILMLLISACASTPPPAARYTESPELIAERGKAYRAILLKKKKAVLGKQAYYDYVKQMNSYDKNNSQEFEKILTAACEELSRNKPDQKSGYGQTLNMYNSLVELQSRCGQN